MNKSVSIYRTQPGGRHPRPATAGSVGIDLPVNIESAYYLFPHHTALLPTGLFITVPQGYEAQIRPRSGVTLKTNIRIPNAPGTIDPDYRGEIQILLTNVGERVEIIRPNDRVAQLVIAPVAEIAVEYSEHHTPTERGSGGFGSTGR